MAMPIARGPGPEARILLYISAAFSAQARGFGFGFGPRARSAMAASAIVLPDGRVSFEARIVRPGVLEHDGRFRPESIGLELGRASRIPSPEPIMVLSIDPGGHVDQWNRRQRDAGDVFVQPGDRLVAVNGHHSHDYICDELSWKRLVVLDFLRPAPRVAG